MFSINSATGFAVGDPVYVMPVNRCNEFFAAAVDPYGEVEIDGHTVPYFKTSRAEEHTAPLYDGDIPQTYTAVPGEIKNAPNGQTATDVTSGDWIPPILIEHGIIAIIPIDLCNEDIADATNYCCTVPGDAQIGINPATRSRRKHAEIDLPDGATLTFEI